MTTSWWRHLTLLAAAAALVACSGNGNDGTADPDAANDTGLPEVSEDVLRTADGLDEDVTAEEDSAPGYDLYLLDSETQAPEPLSLYGLAPSKGKTVGGDQVVITGTGFAAGMTVWFGFQKATDVYVLSGKKATAISPAGFPGPVDVKVVNEDGSSATLQDGFLYYNPVDITAIDPAAGPTAGGVPVMVTGTGFSGDTQLVIGDKIAIDTKVMDDSTLLAVTPPGQPGWTSVSVSTKSGLSTLLDSFFYYEYPEILEVSPAAGGAAGGAVVHVHMKGAHEEAQVFFGDEPAASISFVDYHLLEVVSPPGDVGFVDVTVTTPYGSDTREEGFFYYGGNVPPQDVQIVSVQPATGPSAGGNAVQITAFGLTNAADTTVLFGKKVAPVMDVVPGLMRLTVKAPAAPAGSVKVTLMNSNGSAVRPDGYTYLPIATLHDLAPDTGPAGGGTKVVITGAGFAPDAQVYFGALPAAQVVVAGDTQLSAVTPMGSPGPVDVAVLQAGTQAVLADGFTYQGPLDAHVVVPNFGSIAGGTFIKIIGSGFASGAKVNIAGAPCSHVVVESYNVITAKTPPGVPGTFDVEVNVGGKTAVVPLAYTYFDPVSFYGGTWGGDIFHSVNVTVLDGNSGAPLPDAFVMLWSDPDTPYQGYTDINGQVTFSGADLLGEQMVTASKECYSNSSVVEYNASNVTVYLTYVCPSQGGGMPPGLTPPVINGRVWGFGKYVVIPPGPCNFQGGNYPHLCQSCSGTIDCGSPDNLCANLGDQGKKCLTACTTDEDCPTGFACTSLQGGGDFGHCLPLGGEKMIFCSTTKGHFLGENALNGDGGIADDEGYFSLVVEHLGEVAVVCVGGVLPTCYSDFDCTFADSKCLNDGCWMGDGRPEMTPYALGVARHISLTASGQVVDDVNIQMDIPMTRKVNVFFEESHLNSMGPNAIYSKAFIDFGSDGVFEFLEFPVKFYWDMSTTLTFQHLPSSLTGNIADTTFAIFGASVTAGENAAALPKTFALLTSLTDFEDDTMYIKGSQGWQEQASGIKQNLYDLWGAGWTDVYGVGLDGAIVHFNGYGWQTQQSPVKQTLRGVHGADGSVWAVGDAGTVVRKTGGTWQEVAYPKSNNLRGIWASADTFAVAAGDYTIDRWDGAAWVPMSGSTGHKLNAVWGVNSQNVWAVGDYGKVVRYGNGTWSSQPTVVSHSLRDIWGTSPSDIWAVGDAGTVLHFDGVEWTAVDSGTLVNLNAVFGLGADDVTIAGAKGTLLHWDGQTLAQQSPDEDGQDLLALFGDAEEGMMMASGNHQVVLGPFVSPVTIAYPQEGATMEQEYLQWEAMPGGPDASFNNILLQQPSMAGPVTFWDFMSAGDVTYVDLPDFPNIEGTPGVPAGFYIYTVQRVFKEGFDIDNFDFTDLDYRTWKSWSQVQQTFVAE